MQKLEAIIQPHKLDDARHALSECGAFGMTVSEVRGFGRQKGHSEIYRGAEYVVDLLPKIKLEAVIPDDAVDLVTEALASATRSGRAGDGKIFISPVRDAVRIRTGESGEAAVT